MQQNQENPDDENSRLTSFLQKMIGNSPSNGKLDNLLAKAMNSNPDKKGIDK